MPKGEMFEVAEGVEMGYRNRKKTIAEFRIQFDKPVLLNGERIIREAAIITPSHEGAHLFHDVEPCQLFAVPENNDPDSNDGTVKTWETPCDKTALEWLLDNITKVERDDDLPSPTYKYESNN